MFALRFQLEDRDSIGKAMEFKISLEFQRPRIDRKREPMHHTISFSVPIIGKLRKQLFSVLNDTNHSGRVR